MNMLDHYLVQSYNWNNRRPRRPADGEFDPNAWEYAPQGRKTGAVQYFHPGMVSVTLALLVLIASL